MSKKLPLISILICNYNYESYIEEALKSAASQMYDNIEIIVVDDGSVDSSVKVINNFIKINNEVNIKLKVMPTNKGICHARNLAIKMSAGEFFVFLDSDDLMPPDYISKMYKTALKHGADVVYGDARNFGESEGDSCAPEFDIGKLLLYNFINISSLTRKAKVGNHTFDINLNRRKLEDYDFWLGLALKGLKFVKAEGVYLSYRIQEKSRNSNTLSLADRLMQDVDVWKYIIDKYTQLYPESIPDGLIFDEIKYMIKKIGDDRDELNSELNRLNDVIHKELLPELSNREQHIKRQDLDKEILISDLEKVTNDKNDLLNSIEYRTGRLTLKPIRFLKRKVRGE